MTRSAANQLTGIHGDEVVRETQALPAPAGGALEGKLAC
jgi:hypothetical protein